MTLPIQNKPYVLYLPLVDVLDPDNFVTNPTIAAGDFKVSTDGSSFANINTLPVVDPSGSIAVKVTLSANEMNGEKVTIQIIDTAGGEWQDAFVFIDVPTGNSESLNDLAKGDRIESNVRLIVNKAGTLETILDKKITGSLLTPNVTVRTTDT